MFRFSCFRLTYSHLASRPGFSPLLHLAPVRLPPQDHQTNTFPQPRPILCPTTVFWYQKCNTNEFDMPPHAARITLHYSRTFPLPSLGKLPPQAAALVTPSRQCNVSRDYLLDPAR
ncbi:hypothetical protein GGTG_04981 [Gaeumannomyces tritici R3-111a-1]|uniref:Uncharacterized protein n=1 Tax=Gaeumannomyces tritici (strain R3-111a-1) TaxID=644352 RepID=J3NUM5_GAET3|nr:hypothetical protein GGTG_04981 [Gaeumannomyces tritici R3-111a-1]EJT79899.1 hypothetical protein GGTG_04981 [Gaeumannomyces tritici R3-111a-1]